MEIEDYCAIRNEDGTCGANGLECDHIKCYEKMHYIKRPEKLEKKNDQWASHRRGDLRWEDKIEI